MEEVLLLRTDNQSQNQTIFSCTSEEDVKIKCIWSSVISLDYVKNQTYMLSNNYSPVKVLLTSIVKGEIVPHEKWRIISEEEAALLMIGGEQDVQH